MRTVTSVILVVCCLLVVGAAAEGAEMFSPPVFVSTNEEVICRIVNISDQTRSFTFEIIDISGVVRISGGNIIAPNGSSFAGGGGALISGQFYCRLVVSGAKTNYRAAIAVRSIDIGFNGPDLLTLPAD